jgi:2-C-methyl-D-erythritol 4-phosphate cytidylyltransferase/2-C-methyl-D-erythritol 2,4-cyclodiphosphate synthase
VSAPIVLVHDTARALTPAAVFDRVADSVRETGIGTVPVLEVVDTIKRISGDEVLETVDRNELRKAQTPQGFLTSELVAGYAAAVSEYTDDAALMQAYGAKIRLVEGDAQAYKITTPEDLEAETRVGVGTDTHRFTEDSSKPLYLGTVLWEGERGLDGHSDGDALSHAIVDALLSAAGLGDIGSNFGVDRSEFAGANGSVFLTETIRLLDLAGWQVGNVSAQIIGNRPKVGPHRADVESALTLHIGAPTTISATTTDGLGFLGNSEGVAVVATALIKRRLDRLES